MARRPASARSDAGSGWRPGPGTSCAISRRWPLEAPGPEPDQLRRRRSGCFPPSDGTSPKIARPSVDLPEPLSPDQIDSAPPRGTRSETSSTASMKGSPHAAHERQREVHGPEPDAQARRRSGGQTPDGTSRWQRATCPGPTRVGVGRSSRHRVDRALRSGARTRSHRAAWTRSGTSPAIVGSGPLQSAGDPGRIALEEPPRVGVARPVEHVVDRAVLHDLARVHDHDRVAQLGDQARDCARRTGSSRGTRPAARAGGG